MISFVKGLFSKDSIIENGMKAIDKSILTKEEKAEYMLKFVAATQPMNLSRRFIAMCITIFWLINGITLLTLLLTNKFETFDIVSQFAAVYVMPPFTVLVGFYFCKALLSK